MTDKVFHLDTQWAIAAKVPVDVLERVRARLPSWLRGAGSKVIEGNDGFAGLLVFGGPAEEGEPAATKLTTEEETPVYLLDFDDEAPSTIELLGSGRKHRRVHPADLLEEHGIQLPRGEPIASPLLTVGLLEGVTPAQAKKAVPDVDAKLTEHERGTLITEGPGSATLVLALELGCRAYIVEYDSTGGSFACEVIEPGGSVKRFSPTPSPNYEPISSILGETTLDGILRVLRIPRDLFNRSAP
jgi:hypothetical protein